MIDTGGLMSDATKLPVEQQAAAMRSISEAGLPAAIERQAAAGGVPGAQGAGGPPAGPAGWPSWPS
jgi:hypothetical protein